MLRTVKTVLIFKRFASSDELDVDPCLSIYTIPRLCLACLNSLTVLDNPSFKLIRARHPIAVRRLTSNCFFGVPSGLLSSQ